MNIFNKYVWLLNTLRRKRGATLEELRSEWYDSDFARAILPFANAIEVLEPESLRQRVRNMAYDILKNYKSTSTANEKE